MCARRESLLQDLPLERPEDDHARDKEMSDAVWSPIEATAIALTAQLQPGSSPDTVNVVIKIEHADISLQRQDDCWAGRLDVLFAERDDHGGLYDNVSTKIDLRLKSAGYQNLMRDDLSYRRILKSDARANVLRIVVRDAASGSIGSVTVPLGNLAR